MRFLENVRQKLSSEEEELEIEWDEANDLFQKRRQEELDSARQEANQLISETEEIMENLEKNLEEIRDYKDRDDLELVEDVAESFYRSRKNLVRELDTSEDISSHLQELREFMAEFNDVSAKQGAVLKRIEQDSGQLSSSLDKLLDHKERIEGFIEDQHETVENFRNVSGLSEKIQELEEEREKLGDRSTDSEIEEVKSDISNLEDEIEQLKQSSDWKKKQDLEERVDDLEQKKKDLKKDISGNISQLERGLKKLIYSIENDGTEFKNNFKKLKRLKDRNFRNIEDPAPELEEAENIIESEDLLGQRQLEGFRSSASSLSNLDERVQEIDETEEELENTREQLSNLQIRDEIKDLEGRKEDKENELEKLEKRKKQERERAENIQEEISELKEELEKTLDRALDASIELKD